MTQQSGGSATEPAVSWFHSLSTAASVSSLSDMVHGEERTPLVNQSDVEAGHTTHAQYGSSPSIRTSASGEHSWALFLDLPIEENTDAKPPNSRRNSMFKKRVRYYVPSTAWIPDYSISL